MRKVLSIGILVSLIYIFSAQNAPPTYAQSGYLSGSLDCPLPSNPRRIIIRFGNRIIRSDQQSQSFVGPVGVNIPPGRYSVTLASSDPAHPSEVNQTQESWFLRLTDSSNQATNSQSIADLPSNQNWSTQVVNNQIEITSQLVRAEARHAAYPSTNPNSVIPICAALDLALDPPPLGPTSIAGPLAVSPCSGNWNRTDCFTVANPGGSEVEFRYTLDCWDHTVCKDVRDRVTLAPTESIQLGLGYVCSTWQLDLNWSGGRDHDWGAVVEAATDCSPSEPVPGASCNIELVPQNLQLQSGDISFLHANVSSQQGGSVDAITFTSSNPAVANVTPLDDSAPFRTTIEGGSAGSTQVTATGYIGGAPTCNVSTNVVVGVSKPWWQTVGADVTTNGKLISPISSVCIEPLCDHYLIRKNFSVTEGVAVYGGTEYDFSSDPNMKGDASFPGWLANTRSMISPFDSAHVSSLLPDTMAVTSVSGNLNSATFTQGTQWEGYYWYKASGNATINGNITLPDNRKTILIVDGGHLTIRGTIKLPSSGQGFFMAVAGKSGGSGGNIIIDPSVTSTGSPALEGIYISDGEFITGRSNRLLWLKGSVIANGGIRMERDLGANNETSPAEIYQYNPALLMYYPNVLKKDLVIWREAAP